VKANAYGLADQALISATNFITLLVMARALSASAFGAFVLVYTALIFVNSVQAALVGQPHNVLGSAKNGVEYTRFTTATFGAQGLFLIPVVFVFVVAIAVAFALHLEYSRLLLATLVATVAWQLQELTRRVLYTEGRLGAALVEDLLAYGGQAALITAVWHFGVLSPTKAVWVIALTSGVGLLVGFKLLRVSVTTNISRVDLEAHWRFGKWLALAAIGFGLSANLYFYITAVSLGAAASGELKASQLVLGPLNVLLIFLATVLPIRLSRALNYAGEAAFRRTLMNAIALATPVVAAYCLLVTIFATPLLRLIYGERYLGSAGLVALFALYYVVSYVGQIATSVLNARQLSRPIFVANLAGAGSTIILGWLFIETAGVRGAAVGMIFGAALLAMTLLLYLRRNRSRLRAERAKVADHPVDEPRATEGLGALNEGAAIPGIASDSPNRGL